MNFEICVVCGQPLGHKPLLGEYVMHPKCQESVLQYVEHYDEKNRHLVERIEELEQAASNPCCHAIAALSKIDEDKIQELGSCGCKQARNEAKELAKRIEELENILKTSSDLQDKLLVKALEREREMSNELYEALQNCITWWGEDREVRTVMQKFEDHKKMFHDEEPNDG